MDMDEFEEGGGSCVADEEDAPPSSLSFGRPSPTPSPAFFSMLLSNTVCVVF